MGTITVKQLAVGVVVLVSVATASLSGSTARPAQAQGNPFLTLPTAPSSAQPLTQTNQQLITQMQAAAQARTGPQPSRVQVLQTTQTQVSTSLQNVMNRTLSRTTAATTLNGYLR